MNEGIVATQTQKKVHIAQLVLDPARRRALVVLHRMVGRRLGQGEQMIQCYHDKGRGEQAEHQRPRPGHIARPFLQCACQIDQPALAGDHREQVKPDCRDVMRRRAERHQPEDRKRQAKKNRGRLGQRHQGKRDANHKLQADDPETLGPEHVHQRRPERLDDPWQIQPARVERDLGVRDLEVLIHDDRQRHRDHIRDALAEIERRDLAPGAWRTAVGVMHRGANGITVSGRNRNGAWLAAPHCPGGRPRSRRRRPRSLMSDRR